MTLHDLMTSFSDELLEISRSTVEHFEKRAFVRAAVNYGRAVDSNEKAKIMSENSRRIASRHPELLALPKHLEKDFRPWL